MKEPETSFLERPSPRFPNIVLHIQAYAVYDAYDTGYSLGGMTGGINYTPMWCYLNSYLPLLYNSHAILLVSVPIV